MGTATSPVVSGLLKGYSIGMQLRRAALERERIELYRQQQERQQAMEERYQAQTEQEQAEGDEEFQERMIGAGGRRVTPEGLVEIRRQAVTKAMKTYPGPILDETGKDFHWPANETEPTGRLAEMPVYRKARSGQTVRRKIEGEDVAYELPTVEESQSAARKSAAKHIRKTDRAKGKVKRESRAAEEAQFAIPASKIRAAAEGTGDLSVMPEHASGMSSLMGRLLEGAETEERTWRLPAHVAREIGADPEKLYTYDEFRELTTTGNTAQLVKQRPARTDASKQKYAATTKRTRELETAYSQVLNAANGNREAAKAVLSEWAKTKGGIFEKRRGELQDIIERGLRSRGGSAIDRFFETQGQAGGQAGATAVNPETGERVQFDGEKWVPLP